MCKRNSPDENKANTGCVREPPHTHPSPPHLPPRPPPQKKEEASTGCVRKTPHMKKKEEKKKEEKRQGVCKTQQ